MFFELFPMTSTFLLQLAVFGIFSGLSFLLLAALLPQISRIIAPRLRSALRPRKRECGQVTIFASHGELTER